MAIARHESIVNMLWNQQAHTDRTIPNNKLDSIIHDNEKKKEHACLQTLQFQEIEM